MKHELITANPKYKKKKFNSYFNFKNSYNYEEVFQRIKVLLAKQDFNFFDYETKANIEQISNVVDFFFKNKKNTFFLDHEIDEMSRIDDKELLRYLTYRYRYRKYPELKKISNYPPCIQIEPTSICNYRCVMCYQKDSSFNKKSGGFMGHMKLDLFKKIIDQVDGKLEAVTLASRGEPLLNPAFDQMLKYADQKFLALKLNTNASLLNEKNINSILSTNIQTLVFSIDASEKELYEKIRVNGNFEKIIKNLELFSKVRKKDFSKSKIITRVSGVAINDQVNIKSMTDTWKKYVDTVSLVNYSPLDDTYNNEINNIEEPCLELWRRLFIWWDGKINVCDVDYKSTLSKWNIEENGIKDIWNSEYYNFLRTKHLEAKRSTLEPCIRCIST